MARLAALAFSNAANRRNLVTAAWDVFDLLPARTRVEVGLVMAVYGLIDSDTWDLSEGWLEKNPNCYEKSLGQRQCLNFLISEQWQSRDYGFKKNNVALYNI